MSFKSLLLSKSFRLAFARLFFLGALASFLLHFLFFHDEKVSLEFVKIINTHEHVQSKEQALRYRDIARHAKITRTILLGSPEATLVPGKTGFSGEDVNNLEVLQLAARYPLDFMAVPTLNPEDPAKLAKLKDYRALGASGLKLYSGHQVFHKSPLDAPEMDPIYEYCQNHRLPIIFHVNTGLYLQEFENVLRKYPNLTVVCPHFCLSTANLERLENLMTQHPRLYLDTSFGYVDYLKEAFLRISRHSTPFKKFIERFQDRILFGTDMVVSNEPYKTDEWLQQMLTAYRDILEKEAFVFFDMPDVILRGLHLKWSVLQKIYFENSKKIFHGISAR